MVLTTVCIYLQVFKEDVKQGRKTKSSGCPMLRKQKLQTQFKEELAQSGALDIEDLVKLGQKLGTCPYYGARRAVPVADLVVLPYQSLLHSATRESLGVKLKDCVIIVDEAHNLVDTVTGIHSCQVSATQVSSSHSNYCQSLVRSFEKSFVAQLLKTGMKRMSRINSQLFPYIS